MGTKAQTTSTNSYNPQSLSTYQSLQGPAANTLASQISNPYNNSVFNQAKSSAAQVQGAGSQARQQTSNQVGNALGTSGGSAQIALNQTANLLNGQITGQTNNTLNIGAAGLRQSALAAAQNYRPLQTGGTQTQTTSGVGTWLSPLVQAGASAYNSYQQAGQGNQSNNSQAYSQGNIDQSASSPFTAGNAGESYDGGSAPTIPFNQNGYGASVWGQN